MKTDFKGGGLIKERKFELVLGAPDGFTVPEYIDSRPYCLPASNQGPYPYCAGFAMAGYLEVHRWKEDHIAEQIDGAKIYHKAKELSGDSSAGTTLSLAVQAAQELDLLDKAKKIRSVSTQRDVEFALHKHGVCVAGFMTTKGWNNTDNRTGFIGDEEGYLGGHAVLLCWYDKGSVGFQNSWDGSWGCMGFGRMTWAAFSRTFMYAVVIE